MGGEKREARAPKRRQVAVNKRVGLSRCRMFGRRVNDGRRKMASVALAPVTRSAFCFDKPDGGADANCGRNGLEVGASSRLSVSDHGLL